MNKLLLILLGICLYSLPVKAQKEKAILAGPMLGYSEHREAVIWLQVHATQTKVKLLYYPENEPAEKKEAEPADRSGNGIFVNLHFVLKNLRMGSLYRYEILLNGKKQNFPYPLLFKTRTLWEWRSDPPEFSFITGSCLYVNDSMYDRPGKPYGQGTDILKTMARSQADFMLWLGDNTYTREADYSSESGFWYRYGHTRQEPALQNLLAAMPHFATWDDHDFGPNNAGKSYLMKDISRQVFCSFWANKTYGEKGQGIYSQFSWGDADFFLLDDRFFRDDTELEEEYFPGKSQLGREQLNWLKNALSASSAPFKIIVVGGQFLNEHTDKESFNMYKEERNEILSFIQKQRISGVFFISGDRHHTEMLRNSTVKDKLGYELLELTCSPLSSGANTGIFKDEKEKDNPQRIAGTLLAEPNYCQIFFSGKRKERKMTIKCFDRNGLLKWEYSLTEASLKASR